MKNRITKTVAFLMMSFITSASSAYSVDTHFYESYAMARWAGIGHEVAIELATYNQWIDVQLSSSAMLPTLQYGSRIRRLFHFPTNKVEYKTGEETNHGQHTKIYGLSTINHPMASDLLSEGLRTGNLYLVGAGLHTLMDSAAHSGNPYSFGHGVMGHWPDRPYTFIQKHNEMRKFLFKAFVTIRKTLPEAALDKNLNTTGKTANYKMDAAELFETYSKDETIKKVVESNPIRDPRFVIPTLEVIIETAKKHNLVTDKFSLEWIKSTFPGIFESGFDPREISEIVFKHIIDMPEKEKAQIVNLKEVYTKALKGFPVGQTFNGVTVTREMFFKQFGGNANELVVQELVRLTTWAVVPDEPLRDKNGAYQDDGYTPKAAFETEGVYQKEEKIKVTDWQNGIQKLFGTPKIVFAGSNWFTKAANLFAKASNDGLLDSLERLEKIQMKYGDRMKYLWYTFKYSTLDFILNVVTTKMVKFKLMKTVYGTTRIEAHQSNLVYQMDEMVDKMIETGFYKQLMTEKQVDELKARHKQRMAAELKRLEKLGMKMGKVIRSCNRAHAI